MYSLYRKLGFLGILGSIAKYFLNGWIQKYPYPPDLAWWIFAVSGAGALVITLLTVSYQSIKAALMNPSKACVCLSPLNDWTKL